MTVADDTSAYAPVPTTSQDGSSKVKEAAAKLDEDDHVEKAPRAKCRTWLRFGVLWCCCGLASGVLPGQSLFVNLVADAGVWSSLCNEEAALSAPSHHRGHSAASHHHDSGDAHKSHNRTRQLKEHHDARPAEDGGHDAPSDESDGTCKDQFVGLTAVMQTCQSVALMFLAPIGLFFDRWGARKTGVAGAALCALGTLFIWGSVYGAGQGYDSTTMYLFAVGVAICDFGAMLNSFAFMGLIWHFPGQQALILSLINSTYQVSAFLPMFFELLMAKLDVTLSIIFGSYVVVCLIVTWACWILVPSQSEYYGEAKRVLGMPLPRPPHEIQPFRMLRQAWSVLVRDAADHTASGLAIAAAIALPGFFASFAAPYGEELFGTKEDGNRLAELYVSVNGLTGLLLAPFAGMFADACGLQSFILVLFLTQVVSMGTLGVADWVAQTACAMSLVLFNTLFQIFVSRYLLQYSPPNRIGTVQGVYVVVCVASSLPLSIGAFVAVDMLPEGVNAYRWPMWACGCVGAISLLLYSFYFCRAPPPDMPVLLAEDEAELARNFGCGNLEEVMEVVGIDSRKELVKKLSSTDPDVLRKLIRSIDTDKMLEKMAEKPIEDIAAMMEEGLVGDEDEEEVMAEAAALAAVGDAEAPARRDSTSSMESGEALVAADQKLLRCSGLSNKPLRERESAAVEDVEDEGGPALAKTDTQLARERIAARCDELERLIAAKDKEGIKNYILTEDIEDMWAVQLLSEERWTEAELKKRDKEFDKLIPGKEFAKILRQRPELRTYVQRLMKRELDRKIASMRGKKKTASTA